MTFIKTVRGFIRRAIGPSRVDAFHARRLLAQEFATDPLVRTEANKLAQYRNAFVGRRCIIVGNGPSLASMDLSVLRGEITFGLNRIYLLFDKLGFSTSFLVSVNDYVVQQCASDITAAPCPKFFSLRHRHLVDPKRPDTVLLRNAPYPRFCTDPPSQGVWEGATVTNVAIQLAHFMGFNTVILIGVDHRFSSQGTPHALVVSEGPDTNHFDPTYFGKGWAWQLPDLVMSEESYRMALEQFTRDGRTIVDATVGGALEVFPKVEFNSYLMTGASK